MPVQRIAEFDLWQPGYAAAIVTVYVAGTTTKADIYTDEALTTAAANPQTLQSLTQTGILYGKFAQPLYTSSAYYLNIDSSDTTGVRRPGLTTLAGQDASDATVIPTGGSATINLEDVAGRVIHADNHGDIGASQSAATNNATLQAAIARAAALGGGTVIVPGGTLAFTQFTISPRVVLQGQGRGVTILQSQTAGQCVTLGGDHSGLRAITIDGVNKVATSTGVYSKANNETVLDDVTIKRFETNLHCRGGRRAAWRELYIDDAVTGAKLHGDSDASGDSGGDQFLNNEWAGGTITNCTTYGADLSYEDRRCWNNTIRDVGFEDNTGTALRINGARHSAFPGCWWDGNTTNLLVLDDDAVIDDDNIVIGLILFDGAMTDGAVTFTETCQDVILDRMNFANVDFTLTTPLNNIVVRDCIEDEDVTISGSGTKWTRCRTILSDDPASSGTTTNATATKAWSMTLDPGQVVNIEATVIGVQRNDVANAIYHIARPAWRPGSTLGYASQTANFTLGEILTGATSGATARIVGDADGGATGTLTLKDIVGEFTNGEVITDSAGGSALASGTLAEQNAALLGSTTSIQAAVETVAGWACDFSVSSGDVQIDVTGAASDTVEWVVSVKVTSS